MSKEVREETGGVTLRGVSNPEQVEGILVGLEIDVFKAIVGLSSPAEVRRLWGLSPDEYHWKSTSVRRKLARRGFAAEPKTSGPPQAQPKAQTYYVNPKSLPTVGPSPLFSEVYDDSEELVTSEFKSDGTNSGTIVVNFSAGKAPESIEELLEKCKVDLSVWQVDNYVINTWPTSFVREGEPGQIVNTQVKAWLSKRVLEPSEFQPISPVSLTPCRRQFNTYANPENDAPMIGSKVATTLVLSDPHFGYSADPITGVLSTFHDRKALNLTLNIAADLQPDTIVIAGDVLDLTDLQGKFMVEPEKRNKTQLAIVEASWWLSQLRNACPMSRIVVLEGNHDARIRLALCQNFVAAYGLRSAKDIERHRGSIPEPMLSIPKLLSLEDLDIEYLSGYPDNVFRINDDWVVKHGSGTGSKPGQSCKVMMSRTSDNVIYGHIHRTELLSQTFDGQPQVAMSAGCLCKTDGTVPGSRQDQGWSQGFVVVTEIDGMKDNWEMVPIESGRCMFRGDVEFGVDYSEELAEDSGISLFAL